MDDKFTEKLKWVCLALIVGTVITLVIGSCGGGDDGSHSDVEIPSEISTPKVPAPYHSRSVEELKEISEYWFERAKGVRSCACGTTYSNHANYIEQIITNKLLEAQLSGQP